MIEDDLEKNIFMTASEKTLIDKVLAKDDVNSIRQLIKKPKLSREDILEILYLMAGTESKLLNYSDWERYIIMKFFVWIRDFIQFYEVVIDYEENELNNLDEESQRILNNITMLLQHSFKFLIDLYLNIARSSLSIGAVGLMEILKNKFEMAYNENVGGINGPHTKTGDD